MCVVASGIIHVLIPQLSPRDARCAFRRFSVAFAGRGVVCSIDSSSQFWKCVAMWELAPCATLVYTLGVTRARDRMRLEPKPARVALGKQLTVVELPASGQ